MNADPRAHLKGEWIGKRVRFDHKQARLSGTIVSSKFAGYKGSKQHPINDYILTIQGRSGKRLSVSMFDSYATIEP